MAHETKESRGKKYFSHLSPKLSDKRCSILSHTAQNTKCKQQDWMPKK
jgi:hypothetical protein